MIQCETKTGEDMGANERKPVYIVTGYEDEQIPEDLTTEEALEYQFKDTPPPFETLPIPEVSRDPVFEPVNGWTAVVDSDTGEVVDIERDEK